MKYLITLTILGFASLSIAAELTEASFHDRVYVGKDGGSLELFPEADPDAEDKGFKNCVIRWKDGTALFNCSWEYAKKEKAIIVWVNGNRDYWDVIDDGDALSDGDEVRKLSKNKPKNLTAEDLVGRAYQELGDDSSTEIFLLDGKSKEDGRKPCVHRWASRERKEKPGYVRCTWETNAAVTSLSLYVPNGKGGTVKNRVYEVERGGRTLSNPSRLVQITYPH